MIFLDCLTDNLVEFRGEKGFDVMSFDNSAGDSAHCGLIALARAQKACKVGVLRAVNRDSV